VESLSLTERDNSYLGRGQEHRLKTELIKNWGGWIVKDMDSIRSEARNDCHHPLADPVSERAGWELTELDTQLAWEWTRRELSLITSSIRLEDVLDRRMKECIDKVVSRDEAGNDPKSTAPSPSSTVNVTKGKAVTAEEQGNKQLKEWMQFEFAIGRRKRLEKERGQTKERMEKEMKAASERAEKGGRLWRDQEMFNPQDRWEAGLEFIDNQWRRSIGGRDSTVMPHTAYDSDLDDWKRHTFVEQVRRRFKHWNPQRENERRERDVTIKCIANADSKHLDEVYQYPEPNSSPVTERFVKLKYIQPRALAKLSSATVYDLGGCEDVVWDDILKSTTCSVVNVDPALVDSIPQNDHLLYIGSDSGKEPAFVQQNRVQWWGKQTRNSYMFYFSPEFVFLSKCAASNATIAHIFIFITTPSRLRLGLVHERSEFKDTYVSIQENSKELGRISTNEIPAKLRLKEFELDQPFKPGNHELELIVTSEDGYYCLWDIVIEFFNDPPSFSSVDKDGDNLATMVEHGGRN